MGSGQGNLGGNHPCIAGQKICIQVTGHGHQGKPQKLYFYDQELNQPKIIDSQEITSQAIKINAPTSDPDDCPSTLFHWEQCDIKGLKLGLQIDKAQGDGKIYLPLASKVLSNADYDSAQHKYNQLIAFIPFSIEDLPRPMHYFTQNFNQPRNPNFERANVPTASSDTLYSPAREGYLYIFYQNKLWREILIKQDTQGKNTYKDIDVQSYRTPQGTFPPDKGCEYKIGQKQNLSLPIPALREAEGAPLEEIWIPHRISGENLTVKMMYCEDQLSSERLNLIEQALSPSANSSLKKQINIDDILTTVATSEKFFRYAKGTIIADSISAVSPAFRMDYLPTKRARNENIEWRLFYSAHYMIDISDKALTWKYQTTKKRDDACKMDDTPSSHIVAGNLDYYTEGFEVDAWYQILEEQYNTETSPNEIWSAQMPVQATPNVLAEHKQRYILGIALPDPINELHHMQTLLDIVQNSKLFSYLAIRASQAPYSKMGHFAYNMSYLFTNIKTTINEELSNAVRHTYNRSVCHAERAYLFKVIAYCQDKIAHLLQKNTTIQAILNLLSNHQPLAYTANLNFIANCLTAISKAPIAYDTLTASISADITEGQVLINELITKPTHPLHKALWPTTTFDELKEEPTEQTPQSGDNDGTGAWYTPALTAVRGWSPTTFPQKPPVKLFSLMIQAQNQLETNLLRLKDELKIGWAGIYNITTLLTDPVTSARNAATEVVKNEENALNQRALADIAKENAQKSSQAVQTEQEQLERLNQKRAELRAQDQAARRHLNAKEQHRFDLQQRARASLNNATELFHNKDFLPSVAQMRQSIPQLKALRYILPSQAGIRYVALGLYTEGNLKALQELLDAFPSGQQRAPGTLIEKLTQLLALSGKTLRDMATFASDVFVLGIPNAVANRKLIAAYADAINESFDAMLEKIATAGKRTEAIKTVLAQRNLLARAVAQNADDLAKQLTANNLAKQAEELLTNSNTRYNTLAAQQSEFGLKNEAWLKHPAIPGVLFLIELCNIYSVASSLKQTYINSGIMRAVAGGGSALIDGGFAFALFVERFNGNRAKAVAAFLDAKSSSRLLQIIGLGSVPMRGLIGGGAMALTAIVSFWDAMDCYNDNNPAWMGYAITGTGATVLMIQSFAGAALTGPVGWLVLGIGIGLMLLGTYIAGQLDNSNKVKEWFKKGPFGHNTDKKYQHLYNEQEAILRLLNILLQINLTSETINQVQVTETIKSLNKEPLTETEEQKQRRIQQLATQRKMQNADIKVSVRCLCANLFSNFIFLPALALYEIVNVPVPLGFGTSASATRVAEPSLVQSERDNIDYHSNGIDLYLKIMKVDKPWYASHISIKYQWVLQLQIQTYLTLENLDKQIQVFPTPKLDDGTKYELEIHSKVPPFPEKQNASFFGIGDVDMAYQPYWFNQIITTSR